MSVVWALVFGFIGYCVASGYGLYTEFCFTLILGLLGVILGYGYGLALAYSCKAIASRRLRKSQTRNQ